MARMCGGRFGLDPAIRAFLSDDGIARQTGHSRSSIRVGGNAGLVPLLGVTKHLIDGFILQAEYLCCLP